MTTTQQRIEEIARLNRQIKTLIQQGYPCRDIIKYKEGIQWTLQ